MKAELFFFYNKHLLKLAYCRLITGLNFIPGLLMVSLFIFLWFLRPFFYCLIVVMVVWWWWSFSCCLVCLLVCTSNRIDHTCVCIYVGMSVYLWASKSDPFKQFHFDFSISKILLFFRLFFVSQRPTVSKQSIYESKCVR